MNFSEARFWELLALGLGAIFLCRIGWSFFAGDVQRYDKAALFLLGIFLLGNVSALTVGIFLVIAIGTYCGLAWITRPRSERRRSFLYILIPLQFAPLLYYKYANFVANEVFGVHLGTLNGVMIPVGISFYTFQKIAFVLDTLHFGKPLPKFWDYLNFAAFFPQIVAGPIERRDDLLPQMEAFRFRWVPIDIDRGVSWIALGLFFKCCLADNLALFFDPGSASNAYLIWMANFIFGLRIYYDFAGYSLVALGLARCLGVRLTLNFASPYSAATPTDFWRRWHITLSQWFRDYVYIPLGGGRVRWWWLNLLLVFAISGVWHGAGWNFLLWGLLHGVFLILHRLLAGRLVLPVPVSWAITMAGVFVAWLCFYELSPGVLVQKAKSLLTPSAYGYAALTEAARRWTGPNLLVLVSILALAGITLVAEWRSIARKETPYTYLLKPWVLCILVVLVILLAPARQNDFIYFAF